MQGLRTLGIGAVFVEFHACGQQRHAARRVTGVHRHDVGGGQRIGHDAHPHAARGHVAQHLDAAFARHEIGCLVIQFTARGLACDGQRARHGRRGLVSAGLLAHRRLRDHVPVGPGHVLGAGQDPCQKFVPARAVFRIRPQPLRSILAQVREMQGVIVGRRRCPQRLHRHRDAAVPVFIETAFDLAHHLARGEQIHVAEIGLRAPFEITVADIAPAHHDGRPVHGEHLVVHAVAERAEVHQQLQIARPARAAGERVEQAHLDVGMRVDARQRGVVQVEFVVVQQQAHAHAAIGGGDQLLDQEGAALVGVEDVVLDVDGTLGHVGQRGAGQQRADAVVDEPEARPAVMARLRRCIGSAEARGRDIGERLRRYRLVIRRDGRAGRQQQRAAQRQAGNPTTCRKRQSRVHRGPHDSASFKAAIGIAAYLGIP